MKRINLAQAISLLENDKTGTLTLVYFAVGNNHPQLATNNDRELGRYVVIDAGKCSNIRRTCCELATCSLMGGIYTL